MEIADFIFNQNRAIIQLLAACNHVEFTSPLFPETTHKDYKLCKLQRITYEGRFMDEQYYKTRHMPFENFGRRELPYRESSVPQYDERYPRNVHEDEQRRAASNKHTSCETYDYRSDSMPYSKYHLTRQIPRDVEHKSYDTRPFYDYNHKPASYVPHRDRYSEYEEHFYEHRG